MRFGFSKLPYIFSNCTSKTFERSSHDNGRNWDVQLRIGRTERTNNLICETTRCKELKAQKLIDSCTLVHTCGKIAEGSDLGYIEMHIATAEENCKQTVLNWNVHNKISPNCIKLYGPESS